MRHDYDREAFMKLSEEYSRKWLERADTKRDIADTLIAVGIIALFVLAAWNL